MEKDNEKMITQQVKFLDKLGRRIEVGPKSCVQINGTGFKVEYFVEAISLSFMIGENHTAELTMTLDAWNALKRGDLVHIITLKELEKKYKARCHEA